LTSRLDQKGGWPIHYEGRYFMCARSSLVPMPPDRLGANIEEGYPEFIDQDARRGCPAENVVQLLDVQSYFDLKRPPCPSTCKEALEIFSQKSFLRFDDSNWSISNLGTISLAKRLTDFESVGPVCQCNERHLPQAI
jgi:ATP-dependent DNA helicase RecG